MDDIHLESSCIFMLTICFDIFHTWCDYYSIIKCPFDFYHIEADLFDKTNYVFFIIRMKMLWGSLFQVWYVMFLVL